MTVCIDCMAVAQLYALSNTQFYELVHDQLANFGGRIVAYIICAETETGWHFPVTYNYFYNSATIILSDELIFLISDLLT
jgi:hypothetical protein